MDCGSYSKEIIATAHRYCNKFYIRASRYESLSNEISEITDWKQVELNFENYEVSSILFTAFMEEENYRLVIQRKKMLRMTSRKMDKNGKKMGFEYLFPKTVSFIMANLTSIF